MSLLASRVAYILIILGNNSRTSSLLQYLNPFSRKSTKGKYNPKNPRIKFLENKKKLFNYFVVERRKFTFLRVIVEWNDSFNESRTGKERLKLQDEEVFLSFHFPAAISILIAAM